MKRRIEKKRIKNLLIFCGYVNSYCAYEDKFTFRVSSSISRATGVNSSRTRRFTCALYIRISRFSIEGA